MTKVKLGKVANIINSSVDKKIKENEKEVRLCNFTDVYKNWAITSDMLENLMEASANENEINKFCLKKGQVAITKDSETREDIGMSTYIADNFDNVILGYHCTLITPDETKVNGKYLNAYLNSGLARKYFSNLASGSGQRYTLTVDAIENIEIILPDIKIQERIGDLFSDIDRKIKNNNKINSELESLVKTIYDYWFLQFEFPNEEGKPYKSSGGKMVWNEELKRVIPEGWTVTQISKIANLYQPVTITDKDFISNGKYFVYGANGIIGKYNDYNHENREIAICCRGASCGNYLMTIPESWITGNSMVVSLKNELLKEYIFWGLNKQIISKFITGSAQPQITRTNLNLMVVTVPTKEILIKFNHIIDKIRLRLEANFKENQQLESLRDFLLPLLMNGQVSFKEGEENA